jgi:hypothetical protein
MRISNAICLEIEKRLKTLPIEWDGKNAILEMKNAGYKYWRQVEWIGFYFQFLCEKHLADLFEFQVPLYGKVAFDGLYQFPFDFKVHAVNASLHKMPINDREVIECGIRDYGAVGLIIAIGDFIYNDEDRAFQRWHETLKGNKFRYVPENKRWVAWNRPRKVGMALKQVLIVEINSKALEDCCSFQTRYKNFDGSTRREKVVLNLEKLNEEIIYRIKYDSTGYV